MATKASATKEVDFSLIEVKTGRAVYCVLGSTPLIFNAMSEKARRELLLPSGRKNAAEKQSSIKHDPMSEYRNSVYRTRGDAGPTRLCFPATGFKAAICTAALDMPGAKKSQIGRLVWCNGDQIEIYGVPQLLMSVVRSADMNRTPDVRTRAIVPQWACIVSISFAEPLMREAQIGNLLAAAGLTVGIGDYRQEKGKGSYGQFVLVDRDDEDFKRVIENGGREAQDEALDSPAAYDIETEQLLGWYGMEIDRRTAMGRIAKIKEAA